MSYEILLGIQYMSVFFLLLASLYVFQRLRGRLHAFLFLYIITTLVNNTGYLLEMVSDNSQAALVATKLCYLGKSFIPLAFLVLTLGFSGVTCSKKMFAILAGIHTTIFLLVLTCEYQTLFYTGWTFVEEGLFPHNSFGHGIAYILYEGLILIYVAAGLASLIRAYRKEKIQNRRVSILIFIASVLVEIAGFAGFLMGLGGGYDITSLSYAVSTCFMYVAILKYGIMESMQFQEDLPKLQKTQQTIITGMATLVESRDNSTGDHIKRTSHTVKLFTDHLLQNDIYPQYDETFYNAVVRSAPMHDLGKIAVDDGILRKPGKFTPEEFEAMKAHSANGAVIVAKLLSDIDDSYFRNIAVNVAHYHHEKWNGSGYPCGLKAEQIPFESRIMALADVFDALVSKRCYKDSFSFDKAFGIIEESLGSHFDPELGRQFLKLRNELEKMYSMENETICEHL